MNTVDIQRIAVHECCHAVLVRLFRDAMSIEGIVLNRFPVKPGQDQGFISISFGGDHIANAIALLAGVVGENKYLKGRDEIVSDNSIMDWSLAWGDLNSFQSTVFALRLENICVDEGKMKELCLRFLIDFLNDRSTWEMVERLSCELLNKHDLTLNNQELESIFARIGLDALLDITRQSYMKKLEHFKREAKILD